MWYDWEGKFDNLKEVREVVYLPRTEGISTTSGMNIIVADSAPEFNNAIFKLIENRDFFDSISKNAIEFIHEKFDNLTSASKLIDFYKQHI